MRWGAAATGGCWQKGPEAASGGPLGRLVATSYAPRVPPTPAADGRALSALLGAGAPIETLALAYARDVHPDLDEPAVLEMLESMADVVAQRAAHQTTDEGRAHVLLDHLYGDLGLAGNEASYYDPRNSYLHEVLARRLGIPITLAVILMAVGRRAGMHVEGIGFPGHFLARLGTVLIDPFEGVVLDPPRLAKLAVRTLGNGVVRPEHLAAIDERTMLVRMLLNLKHAYERRSEHAQALLVADRLVDLTTSIVYRRDRGLHALALGAHRTAVADLEAYLAEVPNPPDASEVRRALARARASNASAS
jgi:regulator of sirC expression with transglutaminase-like and TPR domain